MTYNVAILGASGYTGAELVRLIATHPGLQIVGAVGQFQGRHGDGRCVSASAPSRPAAC